jgi:hypothetical protein
VTKVIFVGGPPCEFCRAVIEYYPSMWRPSALVKGRAYTVTHTKRCFFPLDLSLSTTAYRLAEITYPASDTEWQHCSCEFREIEGEADAWQRIVEESRPRTRELELEPA